jgi:hypothetical protein
MKAIISIMTLMFGMIAYGGTTTCKQVGKNWFVVNAKGTIVGSTQYGYNTQEFCLTSVATEKNGVVCSWNDSKFQPYNVELATPLGTPEKENQYERLEDCSTLVALHEKEQLHFCAWNGKYFVPYNRKTNKTVSDDTHGWTDAKDCVEQSVASSTDQLICGWNQLPTLYAADRTPIASTFKNMEDCNGFINSLRLLSNPKLPTKIIENTKLATKTKEVPLAAFNNGKPDEKVGMSIDCAVKEHFYFHTKSKDGYILPECAPDTLYSWGGFDKVAAYLHNLPDGKPWPEALPRTLFATPSAASTFGYGTVPLRFKIKPGVKFKLFVQPGADTCESFVSKGLMIAKEFQDTIPVRLDSTAAGNFFLEFSICTPTVIESWSFGTKEHFDEIIKDHIWMTTQHYYKWEAYYKIGKVDQYLNTDIDAGSLKTDFSEAALKSRMAFIKTITRSKMGQVFVPAGVDAKTLKANHFTTKHPIYFNPQ